MGVRKCRRAVAIALTVLLLAGPAKWLKADQEKTNSARARLTSVFLPADRELVGLLNRARQLQQQGRYADAVRCVGAVLESPEDYLCLREDLGLPSDNGAPESLKGYALKLLGKMPQEGLDSYELQYGARARQMLAAGVQAGDMDQVAEVSRRFFHTQAGYEATLLLAYHYLEHGSPLAAALALEKFTAKEGNGNGRTLAGGVQFEPGLSLTLAACWLRCAQWEKAESVLRHLADHFPRVRLGTQEVALSNNLAHLLAVLQGDSVTAIGPNQWLMVGGNPMRNAASPGGAPLLSLCWRVPTTDNPAVESMIEQAQSSLREQDRWVLPCASPLAVQDLVLMRTAKNLLAVNFTTGKRIWEVPTDDPFDSAREPISESSLGNPNGPDLSTGLRYRMWGDSTYGTLSSDGQLVFAIEDLPLEVAAPWAMRQMVFTKGRTSPAPSNRLAAYDIRSGKLVWHLGGSEEPSLPLAGSFFLGPPLPLNGQLYVLAEIKGEIRVIALDYDGASAKSTWTQQLTFVDAEDSLFDSSSRPVRRLSGVSPSYAEGVLVCPTGNDSVVGVDLANRALRWGYQYDPVATAEPQRFQGRETPAETEPGSRWANANATIAEGRVLLTPADSQYLHCLDLLSGNLIWKEPREEDLFVACVQRGKAMVVGRNGVRAYQLASARKAEGKNQADENAGPRAEPAWQGRVVEYPNGGFPTGTGFFNEGRYYLPMSTAEVLVIDVETGTVSEVYKSRRGFVPGNLVCYNGRIISQRAGAVEMFYQRDALRKRVDERLAANPKDPDALAQRGEILWDEGNLKEAIACFRTSLELSDAPNSRTLLREALFEGLRTDFASYQGNTEEILRLIEEPRQQAAYLRLMASGHERLSQYREALAFYVKLIGLEGDSGQLERVAKAQFVRRDRWVRVQLATLREMAPADVRAEIDKLAQERLNAARKESAPDALLRYLDYFGGLPAASDARRSLAAKLREQGRLLHAEFVLRALEQTGDRKQAGAALAELASMLHQAKLYDDAAQCYSRLKSEFADVVCREGKTGTQIVAELPSPDPVLQAIRSPSPWPSNVSVARGSRASGALTPYSGTANLAFVGRPSPFYADTSLEWQMNPSALVARDGWGRTRWQATIPDATRGVYQYGPPYWRVAAQDHLLMVLMDSKIMALDTLAASQGVPPKSLWTREFDDPSRSNLRRRNFAVVVPRTTPGPSGGNFPVNVPRVISEQLICYQRFQHLYGIDPISGDALWDREDVRPDSVIFGDGEYVMAVPPDNSSAMVLRPSDGKLLGACELPSPTERIAPCGHNILLSRNEGDKMLLELRDPWQNKAVWPAKQFAAQSRVASFDHGLVGVFEHRSGQFHLIRVVDGQELIKAQLQPETTVSEMFLFQSPDTYTLVVNGLERPGSSRPRGQQYFGYYGLPFKQITRARVYGFDREGGKLWETPVLVEDRHLLMNQPPRLPILLFGQVPLQSPGNTSRLTLFGIDKHSGKTIQPEESLQGHGYFRMVGHPEKKAIEIQLNQEVITLTFRDEPPGPPSTGEALLRAFRRTMQDISQPPAMPSDEQ